jgi:small multidrug resistance pump
LAIVYACWSGVGIMAIAILSYFIYGQSLSWQSILGIFLIINGVILVNIHAIH